jgi:hypothetical protein
MAHWAEIDENNIVIQVTVGDNNDPDEGYQWLIDNLGGTWIKTSYNTYAGKHWTTGETEITLEDNTKAKLIGPVDSGNPHLRYNFAGIGFTYDPIRDAFIPPQPESNLLDENGNEINGEWILNEETCLWDFTPEE